MNSDNLQLDCESDILEDDILKISDLLLARLLKDHSTTPQNAKDDISKWVNIIWATNDYAHKGEGYQFNDPITKDKITGENGLTIRPRALKSKDEQNARSKNMAEVFTPAWICNKQNNLIDDEWFGRKNVFNTENPDLTWTDNQDKITFPEGKTWQDYVYDTRLEISCGEAPYIVSRYDVTTGEIMPINHRIGLLDRKLKIVSQNTDTEDDWRFWAKLAVQSIYGYEYQGDSLLLAREAVLYTYKDFFEDKFQRKMDFANKTDLDSFEKIAYFVSWNIFQMDGLTCCIPGTCQKQYVPNPVGGLMFGLEIAEDPCHSCEFRTNCARKPVKVLTQSWNKNGGKYKREFFTDSIK